MARIPACVIDENIDELEEVEELEEMEEL